MKALRSFAVRAALPDPLQDLVPIALNLRWSWDTRTSDLFRWIDPSAWEESGGDPVKMLGLVSKDRFHELLDDGPFMAFLASVRQDLELYLSDARWYQEHGGDLGSVAYFSPEFGVSEALPIYSGGLGVLAGDHLKAASDLGVPLVGVGLLYREGYFRQHLNLDGWQQERYPALDPHGMPLSLLRGDDGNPIEIEVDLEGVRCAAQLWLAQVGRVPLLLMDCDVEANRPEERIITDRLYGGGSEHRLRQEIVLGIGGVRALQAAGYEADVFHSNEGHAGFMGLERIRQLIAGGGLSFEEATRGVLRRHRLHHPHTGPCRDRRLRRGSMERYFSSYVKDCGITMDRLMELGSDGAEGGSVTVQHGGDGPSIGDPVERGQQAPRHGLPLYLLAAVARRPSRRVAGGIDHERRPPPTWLGPEMAEVLDRRFPGDGPRRGREVVADRRDLGGGAVAGSGEGARAARVLHPRAATGAARCSGVAEADTRWTQDVFDPGVLTIGFARRFAPTSAAPCCCVTSSV